MKISKSLVSVLIIGAMALGASFISFRETSSAAVLGARTSDAGGVRVVVTPRPVDPSATVWEFEVVMDTHSETLNADLTQAAVLVDDNGRRYSPLAWQGDPPGGHHRKGTLRFSLPAGKPKAVELQIKGVGGAGERTFRWELD
jgi:hypothetical protein